MNKKLKFRHWLDLQDWERAQVLKDFHKWSRPELESMLFANTDRGTWRGR